MLKTTLETNRKYNRRSLGDKDINIYDEDITILDDEKGLVVYSFNFGNLSYNCYVLDLAGDTNLKVYNVELEQTEGRILVLKESKDRIFILIQKKTQIGYKKFIVSKNPEAAFLLDASIV